jgi:predicted chitinase
MADKHFVVQGAVCKCSFGNTSSKLKILSTAEYLNDHSGSTKAVASSSETGNPFTPATFGTCTLTHSTCTPGIIKWVGTSSNITLSNEGKILTEDSTAICAVSGSPSISISSHGQTSSIYNHPVNNTVTASAYAQQSSSTRQSVLREIPLICSIGLNLENRATATTFSSNRVKDNTLPDILVRINEPLCFYVEKYENATKADESMVSWKVFDNHSYSTTLLSLENNGPYLNIHLDRPGKYRVMAHGDTEANTSSYLDITATNNNLRDQFFIINNTGEISSTTTGKYQLQKGVPVTVSAVYEIMPATVNEKECVSMQITDDNNNIIAISNTDSIYFMPPNAAATYIVSATRDSGISPQVITHVLLSESKNVLSITNHTTTHLIRPRTSLTFHVSAMNPVTSGRPVDPTAIHWLLNGKEVGVGPLIKLNGDTHFTIPGAYLVEARLSSPVTGATTQKEIAKHGEWHLQVKNNELLQIKAANGNTNWIVGKYYPLTAQTLMPYDESLDGPIMWHPFGAGGNTFETASATQDGKFTISARLGKSTQTLDINARYASITRWCFTDQQNVYKSGAGWKENIRVVINCPEAANEKVHLHLLQNNPANRISPVKDLGIVSFDRTGELKMDISIYSLKPLLTATSFEWDTFNLLFAIAQIANSIQFADMKTIICNNKKYWFPQKQSNRRTTETGKYIRIKSSKEIVSVHFYDHRNYPAYKVYKYGEKIKIHIQTSNLAHEELQLQVWENKFKDEDQCRISKSMRVAENEIGSIIIDTKVLKTGNILEDSFFRCFYVVIKSAAGKYLYPAEIADENLLNPSSISFYQHIKLSDKLDTLLNKLSQSNAPVVLGEPLREDAFTQICPRCNENITVAQLAKIFSQTNKSDLQSVADTYNRYMELTGMNSCWNKAHFFAQVAVESGMSLHLKQGESFNWYWEELGKHFPPFRTVEGKNKAREWGRRIKVPAHPGVSMENQEKIADYVYGPHTSKGISLGNISTGDGWRFRGRGLIQITGRDAYAYANSYTIKENADIINQPDLVATDMKVAVLSAMAFWKWKRLQHTSNGNMVVDEISKAVGLQVTVGGKNNYSEKKKLFDTNTAIIFQVSSCLYKKAADGPINQYRIHIDMFEYNLVQINPASKKYQYDIYIAGKLIKSFLLDRNNKGLLPFPETGPNWGRYGDRDGGDDNYIAPGIAAPLFGFFYSLPKNGFQDKLYFNDISASNKRNLGHIGHVNGNDIDIRYPGSSDRKEAVLWKEAMKAYGSEREFITVLENILSIAVKWKFKNNFAFAKKIKNTEGVSLRAHQNHFHIGLRKKKKIITKSIGTKVIIIIASILMSCHHQPKQISDSGVEKTDIQISEKEYKTNNDIIKQHEELQAHIEGTEDGQPPIYIYTELDVNIALPVIAQGLNDKGFHVLEDSLFRDKACSIFGNIFQSQNPMIKNHDHFITILDKESDGNDEFDYTIDNIFVSKQYKYITWVPLLGDFVIFTDSNHYKIDLHPRLIARNKYLFNNSRPDLAYLLHEDTFFLKTLVKSFGYTKEPKINDLVMNEYLELDDHHLPSVGEIIFVKNAEGILEIKEELLKWISDHTSVNDNRMAAALSNYVDALKENKQADRPYNNNNDSVYVLNPFTLFSLAEKRKIVAYAANTYDPLYDKFTRTNSRIWPAEGILENWLANDYDFIRYVKQQNYFSLPALKKVMESWVDD